LAPPDDEALHSFGQNMLEYTLFFGGKGGEYILDLLAFGKVFAYTYAQPREVFGAELFYDVGQAVVSAGGAFRGEA